MAEEAQEVLGERIIKQLSDRNYDERKSAALEIEKKVKQSRYSGNHTQIQRILECLKREYIESIHPSQKKGGLIGLASVAIGLEGEISRFLQQLMDPVLSLFKDEDARVRYYACEALYNISKVAQEAVLVHFNDIFEGLCKLYADVESDVKNGVQVLDRAMKDIVTSFPAKFEVNSFVPLLADRMEFKNPYVRQLMLAWIVLLSKVPEVDMVGHLRQYLQGLFKMLSDQSRDIRHNADSVLNELRKGVMSSPPAKAWQIILDTAEIVVKCCSDEDACSRLTALCWLYEYVGFQMKVQASPEINGRPDKWVAILPDLLKGTLHCIDDAKDEIARMAIEMNNSLLEMVRQLGEDTPINELVDCLLHSMQSKESGAAHSGGQAKDGRDGMLPVVRTACLQWICMLLAHPAAAKQMLQREMRNRVLAPIFETLLQPDDEVVMAALRVLAQIMEGNSEDEHETPKDESREDASKVDLFTSVARKLLRLFADDRERFKTRGRLMIRQLCGHLDPRRLYVTVAHEILQEADLEFAKQLVRTFSWILLTATETKVLRDELLHTAPIGKWDAASGGQPSNNGLFVELIEPWFHNPVSALALCLWAQQYELATELTARFAEFEPTVDLLTELDQLVHLLESPIFSKLRLRLLEPRRHPDLLKCLLGLAMLLPQAGAFNILRERIHVVQSGLLLELQPTEPRDDRRGEPDSALLWWSTGKGPEATDGGEDLEGDVRTFDIKEILKRFDKVTEAAGW